MAIVPISYQHENALLLENLYQLFVEIALAKNGEPITITKTDWGAVQAKSLKVLYEAETDSYTFSLEDEEIPIPGVIFTDMETEAVTE